ncbi:MAG: bifunctional (p)ppGpp synthetase/guanosine-3',5'-bis(diphosphate) 3'-pyrophosphohydrolase [Alistipes sp.]|nr:bifunctional (p)ppGpp synthetase/guanosine-3',5'-bis(diphosphate) 3'-pyrophosphohydrolase [Alistipes sp.]
MSNYTAEDEKLINEAWEKLVVSCKKICKGEESWNMIKRAYFLAKEAHSGVRRRSGEPYMLHPIAVAQIAVDEIGLGAKSVIAALLHDVVEDTDYTVEDIEHIFGPKIASMVDGLTKMSGVFNAETSAQAEYFRKVLLTLSDDVRVILIKIADRLHNMRTLQYMPLNKQIKITGETIYLFAPLAYRLGLYPIKSELEDLCMKYRFPEDYERINGLLAKTADKRQEYIDRFCQPIREALDSNGFDYEISGRVKSVYSIWTKMQRKQIPFEEVYDLFAIRIVFKAKAEQNEKAQCWQIYSNITDIYAPKQDRLRDWISMPKANGYEALHSTVMGPDGHWVEVQIRTERMEDIAERGFAAHWKYKRATLSQNDDAFDTWLKKIRDALNSPTESAVEFLDNFKLSLYTSEITVFTPKGEQRQLPNGATALDFAYDIHTKVGDHAIGAKINHKIEPVTKTLKWGDQIEIITADTAKPKAEWLDSVTTTKAKQKITAFLKREQENNIENGIAIFEAKLAEFNIASSGNVLRKAMKAYGCKYKDEFYSRIGAGIISLENIEKVLKSSATSKLLKFWRLRQEDDDDTDDISENDNAPADDSFTIAPCCNPLPGDNVVGFRDPISNKIVVHKATCDELNRLASQYGKNIIKDKIKWSQHKATAFLSTIELRGIDRMGMLSDITHIVSDDFSVNMREIHLSSHNGIFEGKISLYIQSADALYALMDKFRQLKGLESVKRIENNEIM